MYSLAVGVLLNGVCNVECLLWLSRHVMLSRELVTQAGRRATKDREDGLEGTEGIRVSGRRRREERRGKCGICWTVVTDGRGGKREREEHT